MSITSFARIIHLLRRGRRWDQLHMAQVRKPLQPACMYTAVHMVRAVTSFISIHFFLPLGSSSFSLLIDTAARDLLGESMNLESKSLLICRIIGVFDRSMVSSMVGCDRNEKCFYCTCPYDYTSCGTYSSEMAKILKI